MVHVLQIPADQILFLHKLLGPKPLENAISRFHGDVSGAVQPRYIVATSSAFGVGLTFSEVVGIGLLEPDYQVATELQLFSRHNRLGNKNPATHSWLFYTLGNEREERIRKRNRLRKQLDKALAREIIVID